MTIRARFKVLRIESSMADRRVIDAQGNATLERVEVRAIRLIAVADPDATENNFFVAAPSGELVLQAVLPDAAMQFVLDQEYYIDFTPAAVG